MRRNVIYLLAAALVLIAIGLVLPECFDVPGVTIQNFRRLHLGMSEEQVGRVFGRAADIKEPLPSGGSIAVWNSPKVTFQMYFEGAQGCTGGETIWTYDGRYSTEFVRAPWWERLLHGEHVVRD